MDIHTQNKLLEKLISFAEKTFASSDKATQYLSNKKITDAGLYSKHRMGYCDGSLINALPTQGKIIDNLTELGIIKNNEEYFDNHIILPITDTENNIKNIVGIDINNNAEKYLFTDEVTLFNLPIINSTTEIYQTVHILDLLSLESANINNVISGQSELKNNQIAVKIIDKNINDILINSGAEAVQQSIQNIDNSSSSNGSSNGSHSGSHNGSNSDSDSGCSATGSSNPTLNPIQNGFSVQYGLRTYQIIGIEKSNRKLKATVKISKGGKIHVDTIDFYSSKMRRQLIQDMCRTLDEIPQTVESDISKILQQCESYQQSDNKTTLVATGTQILPIEEKAAMTFGRDRNIVEIILQDYEKIGFVGTSEDSNKLLCYLSATSRKMGEGNVLSVIILSSSGAGKSKLQDSTLSLMPTEDVIKITNLSAKALFYKERTSLKHKILALEECKASNKEADYAIRTLISSGQLISEVTIRDGSSGKMTTQQNIIDAGSTSVFFTSTNPTQDAETESRFFTIGINESEEQTKEILKFQMNQFSLAGLQINNEIEDIKNKHKNFQRLLKPYKIINPYKIKFTDTRLQARRLFPQILNLINAVCFLRQMQKEIKSHGKINYIEVDKEDIKIALGLAKNILSKSLNELSEPSHNLLNKIDEYLNEQKRIYSKNNKGKTISKSEISFTRKEIRQHIKWSNTRLHTYLKELQNLEYVLLDHGKKNSLQHYRLIYDSDGRFTWLNNVASMIKIE